MMARTRESFQPSPRDRQQMHNIPNDDLPEVIAIDLDSEDPIDFTIVDDTPDEDKGKPTKWDGKSTTEDPPLQGVHPKVQKRIDRLRAETETERRGREAAERERQAAIEIARQKDEEIADLRRRLDTGSTALATSMKEQREARLVDAENRLAQAHADGDSAAIAKATRDISTASAELAQIAARTPVPRTQETQQRQPEQQTQQRTQAPSLAPNVAAWIAHNDRWFNKDQAKTRFALSIHEAVVSRGVRPDSEEYTRELDKGMAAMYPDHQPYRSSATDDDDTDVREERSNPRRTNVAERGSREGSALSPQRRTVELTASEVAVARSLGLRTDEQLKRYALEKQKREANGKGGA
jgi:hypothetical protein